MPDLNDLIRYFDLQSGRRPAIPQAQSQAEEQGQRFPVIPQYCALVVGVFVQPFLAEFQRTHVWNLAAWPGWLIFSVLVALAIFPSVYKHSIDRNSNIFLHLCLI